MKYSEDKIAEIKERIRLELVKSPAISIVEIQSILSDNCGHIFDKNFIGKLKRKIHQERAYRYNSIDLHRVLAELEDAIKVLSRLLWKIIEDPESSNRDKISAIREIRSAKTMLLESLFNAGIFERKMGEMKLKTDLTPEQGQLLEEAVEKLYGHRRKTKVVSPSLQE